MTMERASIECCLPHAGAMLLLDSVVHWDAAHIVCRARPPAADHPLARAGSVPTLVAAEYGAQAAAVHGFLLDRPATPRAGMLAKLSDVELHAPFIPANCGPLAVTSQLVSRTDTGCLYDFDVACSKQTVARGRLMVAFGEPGVR
jgi:predicted hotdog family 3-hydroxylacyl-ACP dehydratase